MYEGCLLYTSTFNDDAMVNTLNMIRDMMNHKAPDEDDLIDKALCVRLGKAFNKGIELSLIHILPLQGRK